MSPQSRATSLTGVRPITIPTKTAATRSPLNWKEHQPLDSRSFPNPERRSGIKPCTKLNVDHILKAYGIEAKYDVVAKKVIIDFPDWKGTAENEDNAKMAMIVSLAEPRRRCPPPTA